MLDAMWAFLTDDANRAVLGWIGGGVVIAMGGLWTVVRFFLQAQEAKRGPKSAISSTISATEGGVAAGRDIRDSNITTRGSSRDSSPYDPPGSKP
jgi:hypothetical protein